MFYSVIQPAHGIDGRRYGKGDHHFRGGCDSRRRRIDRNIRHLRCTVIAGVTRINPIRRTLAVGSAGHRGRRHAAFRFGRRSILAAAGGQHGASDKQSAPCGRLRDGSIRRPSRWDDRAAAAPWWARRCCFHARTVYGYDMIAVKGCGPAARVVSVQPVMGAARRRILRDAVERRDSRFYGELPWWNLAH